MSTWAVHTRTSDDEPWTEVFTSTRCSLALAHYVTEPEPRRLLRNGTVIRMTTTTDQLDLFHEEDTP